MGSISQDFNSDFDIGINRWPDELPQCPLLHGFVEQRDRNVVDFQPEVGTVKLRRRTTEASTVTSMTFRMTESQVEIFNTFFRVTLRDGAYGFQMAHPVTRLLYWWVFAKNQAPRIERFAATKYLVAFSLVRFLQVPAQVYLTGVRFSGRGNASIECSRAPWSSVRFSGSGNLSARGSLKDTHVATQFAGEGNLRVRDSRQYLAEVRFNGEGNLIADQIKYKQISLRYAGTGNLLAVQRQHLIPVRFNGSGGLRAGTTQKFQVSAQFGAFGFGGIFVSHLSVYAAQKHQVQVRFAGAGNVSARHNRQLASAVFSGSGNLSARQTKFISVRFGGTGNARIGAVKFP